MSKIKTKPFNLEAAKAGKTIVTRDGRRAQFVQVQPLGIADAHPLRALMWDEDGDVSVGSFELSGAYYSDDEEDPSDLFTLDDSPPVVKPWTRETCPLGAVVKSKDGSIDEIITSRADERCWLGANYHRYKAMLQSYTLADGSPCGTEE